MQSYYLSGGGGEVATKIMPKIIRFLDLYRSAQCMVSYFKFTHGEHAPKPTRKQCQTCNSNIFFFIKINIDLKRCKLKFIHNVSMTSFLKKTSPINIMYTIIFFIKYFFGNHFKDKIC